MTEEAAGYITEVDYTYWYFQQLNPLTAKLELLSAGIAGAGIQVGL